MKGYDKEIFSCRLKAARTKCKLKQSELAELAGISKATISSYERTEGAKIPSLETAYQIAKFLGVSLDWLCGEEKEVDYADFDAKTYLTALVIVLSEMSSKVTVKRTEYDITIDNDILGDFLQKIDDLIKVYYDNFIDTENFKICVNNTIERYSKRAVIVGNRLISNDGII